MDEKTEFGEMDELDKEMVERPAHQVPGCDGESVSEPDEAKAQPEEDPERPEEDPERPESH